jgi:hypothetical protein
MSERFGRNEGSCRLSAMRKMTADTRISETRDLTRSVTRYPRAGQRRRYDRYRLFETSGMTVHELDNYRPLALGFEQRIGWSQWPRGLRHELSSLDRRLGSWVLITLEAWLFVCVYSVFLLFCLGRDLATSWSSVQWVLMIAYTLRNRKSGQGPTKGRRVIIE